MLAITIIGVKVGYNKKSTASATVSTDTRVVYSTLPDFSLNRVIHDIDTVYVDTCSHNVTNNHYEVVVDGHSTNKELRHGEGEVKTVTREVPVLFIATPNGDPMPGTPRYKVQRMDSIS